MPFLSTQRKQEKRLRKPINSAICPLEERAKFSPQQYLQKQCQDNFTLPPFPLSHALAPATSCASAPSLAATSDLNEKTLRASKTLRVP